MKEKIKKIVKEITLERIVKVSIVFAILLISVSIFYYYVIFLPQKEQTRLEQQRQEQLAKEIKEQEAKIEAEQALNTCIANAESDYSNQWYRECKGQGKLTSRCISLHEMTFEEYKKQNPRQNEEGLDTRVFDFYKERDECSCRLPLDNADRINKTLQDNKDECFKKYPQK